MPELKWIASSSASALYAAAGLIAARPATDERLAAALAPASAALASAVAAAGTTPEAFFGHAIALAAGIENDRELARLALAKLLGPTASQATAASLAGAIAAVENALRVEFPAAADELALRAGPLRELWEARGPGLLSAIGRATDPELIVARADVLVVHPLGGGGGRAFLPYNAVAIEAVLANPHPTLPEVARLAWLLAALHHDLPSVSEGIPAARLPRLAALALLPATLAGAEYVELARCDRPTIAEALQAWHVVPASDVPRAAQLAATLDEWWNTHVESRPAWRVSLLALDQMLAATA